MTLGREAVIEGPEAMIKGSPHQIHPHINIADQLLLQVRPDAGEEGHSAPPPPGTPAQRPDGYQRPLPGPSCLSRPLEIGIHPGQIE
ncbi:hypothetical protein KUCAC02_036013 [Chaenocephalus aceratus]|nr:hypothetical protein KUCAC02_036013 [Chaenocephalus aceratus]